MKGIAGDTFKDTDLRVYEREMANPDTVFKALTKGGIVIPVVSLPVLGLVETGLAASVIVSVNREEDSVELYIPLVKAKQSYPVAKLVEAWVSAGGKCTTAFPRDANTYHPKLIDLKYVELSSDFDELREAIAENAHDTWAMERQSEGWTYGPKRDDAKLETPDMRPYAELPESEKQYDRIMAEDTLKLLTALGYRIERE